MRKAHAKFDGIIGLTIEGVAEIGAHRVFTFTDGTCAVLCSSGYDEHGAPELSGLDDDPLTFQKEQYVAAGIWTQEDFDADASRIAAVEAVRAEVSRREAEYRDRENFKRLCQKYGTPTRTSVSAQEKNP